MVAVSCGSKKLTPALLDITQCKLPAEFPFVHEGAVLSRSLKKVWLLTKFVHVVIIMLIIS